MRVKLEPVHPSSHASAAISPAGWRESCLGAGAHRLLSLCGSPPGTGKEGGGKANTWLWILTNCSCKKQADLCLGVLPSNKAGQQRDQLRPQCLVLKWKSHAGMIGGGDTRSVTEPSRVVCSWGSRPQRCHWQGRGDGCICLASVMELQFSKKSGRIIPTPSSALPPPRPFGGEQPSQLLLRTGGEQDLNGQLPIRVSCRWWKLPRGVVVNSRVQVSISLELAGGHSSVAWAWGKHPLWMALLGRRKVAEAASWCRWGHSSFSGHLWAPFRWRLG